jgi:hypothetical protein
MKEFDRNRVGHIMDFFKCPKGFKCYKSGFDNLCKAKDTGDGVFIECLEENPQDCPFSLRLSSYFCKCPLRIYIIQNLKK